MGILRWSMDSLTNGHKWGKGFHSMTTLRGMRRSYESPAGSHPEWNCPSSQCWLNGDVLMAWQRESNLQTLQPHPNRRYWLDLHCYIIDSTSFPYWSINISYVVMSIECMYLHTKIIYKLKPKYATAYQLVFPKPLTRPFLLKYVKLLRFGNQASLPPFQAPWGVTHEWTAFATKWSSSGYIIRCNQLGV